MMQPGDFGHPVEAVQTVDTVAPVDTLPPVEKEYAIVLVNPEPPVVASQPEQDTGMSWVFATLLLLFCIVAFKFRNNTRYISAVINDLLEVKSHHNAFDDTVKETSFLILLNLQWVISAGVLLYQSLVLFLQQPENYYGSMAGLPPDSAPGIALCCGISLVYVVAMTSGYFIIGYVFSDRSSTTSWVKGFLASQSLEAPLMLTLALLSICYVEWLGILLAIAAGVFILGKSLFIFKGFRIFFNQMSSWLLFLYYLCSLEIVPLVLIFVGALEICLHILK